MPDPLLEPLQGYFSGKFEQHGAKAAGVDWGSEERQELCFRQVLRICEDPSTGRRHENFSLLDYGCGYGALAGYLVRHGFAVSSYQGYDMTPALIEAAQQTSSGLPHARFTSDEAAVAPAEYTVGSGLLALKLEVDISTWEKHVLRLLDQLWSLSTAGFAFNSLTKYSDPARMRSDLYYADPCFLFDHCKRRFSRNVALLHDYGAYEFTMLVRHD